MSKIQLQCSMQFNGFAIKENPLSLRRCQKLFNCSKSDCTDCPCLKIIKGKEKNFRMRKY